MTDLAHGLWAAATCSVAFAGHRVAITWLNQRAEKGKRDDVREERESGLVGKFEAIDAEWKAVKLKMETFLANQRAR